MKEDSSSPSVGVLTDRMIDYLRLVAGGETSHRIITVPSSVGVLTDRMIEYLCYMFTKYTDTWFFTATINSWQNLLFPDHRKEIIINALKYLVEQEKIKLHAYVITPNHIHLIITLMQQPADFGQFQLSLLRFTAKALIKDIKEKGNENELLSYKSTQSDRAIHIWERRPKWIAVINHPIYLQKLKYIHLNPLQEKWRLADAPELYPWSSAGFYAGITEVEWIAPL